MVSIKILVTGGLGYIGSHTTTLLQSKGHDVTIIDNLSTSSDTQLDVIETVPGVRPNFYPLDIRQQSDLEAILKQYAFDAVIHFAGLKSVEDSLKAPLDYYENNVVGTLSLLQAMHNSSVRRIIFSSSATVYGNSSEAVSEDCPLSRHFSNAYAATKNTCEEMLMAFCQSVPQSHVTLLRYFNPVGAHPSGLLREQITEQSKNIMPCLLRAVESNSPFIIHGTNYPTPDGTAVRDFIHVMDLAQGHVAALDHQQPGTHLYNLGTGQRTTVLELVRTFETCNGVKLNLQFGAPRTGDIPISFADPSKAQRELNWRATRSLEEMMTSAYRAYHDSPQG